jgi:Zn-dependent protease
MRLGGLPFLGIITLISVLVVSMVIHEFMHGFVAYKLGDTTAQDQGRLSFNPWQHVDPFMTILLPIITLLWFRQPLLAAKPVPFNPARLKFGDYGAGMVAAAGPVSNLLLAFLAHLLLRIAPSGSFMAYTLAQFVGLNVLLAVFNLIPIPPLDGSRVLYAVAPDVVRNLFDQIEPFGFFLIFALILSGSLSSVLGQIDQVVLNLLP